MMWGYGYGWAGTLWMALGSLFWLAILGLAIWLAARWLTTRTVPSEPMRSTMPPAQPSAMEILRQRYARGEIDTETFVTMRGHLEATADGAAAHAQNFYEKGSESLAPPRDT
jgi:putative membrane protein